MTGALRYIRTCACYRLRGKKQVSNLPKQNETFVSLRNFKATNGARRAMKFMDLAQQDFVGVLVAFHLPVLGCGCRGTANSSPVQQIGRGFFVLLIRRKCIMHSHPSTGKMHFASFLLTKGRGEE
jgi:hypothetical protein